MRYTLAILCLFLGLSDLEAKDNQKELKSRLANQARKQFENKVAQARADYLKILKVAYERANRAESHKEADEIKELIRYQLSYNTTKLANALLGTTWKYSDTMPYQDQNMWIKFNGDHTVSGSWDPNTKLPFIVKPGLVIEFGGNRFVLSADLKEMNGFRSTDKAARSAVIKRDKLDFYPTFFY